MSLITPYTGQGGHSSNKLVMIMTSSLITLLLQGEPDQTVLPPKPDPLPPPWTGFSICTLVFLFPVGLVALFCSYMVRQSTSYRTEKIQATTTTLK